MRVVPLGLARDFVVEVRLPIGRVLRLPGILDGARVNGLVLLLVCVDYRVVNLSRSVKINGKHGKHGKHEKLPLESRLSWPHPTPSWRPIRRHSSCGPYGLLEQQEWPLLESFELKR